MWIGNQISFQQIKINMFGGVGLRFKCQHCGAALINTIILGETGLITFDDNGNRQPNFFLTMLDISDQANVVMNITVIGGVAVSKINKNKLK